MQIQQRLRHRADCFATIRAHFNVHFALEVDTPLLCEYSVTDPYMSAMQANSPSGQSLGYLQTSPEYAMKKLLCQGSGDIYQLGKVFRADENSPQHSNEFTLLEWYRLGIDEQALMDEVFYLVCQLSGVKARIDLNYREAFIRHLKIDPFSIEDNDLADFARQKLGELPNNMLRDNYLTLLFATYVETAFAADKVTFIYDFPATQASLAETSEREYGLVARRFEAYAGGLELANGFFELRDSERQAARFDEDNRQRGILGYPKIAIDKNFVAALNQQGLPECSGVALGVDRLLMLKLGISNISHVLAMGENTLASSE